MAQVGSTCYGSDLAAAHAIASAEVGRVVVKDSAAYVVDVSAVSATSITYVLNPVEPGAAITYAAPITVQPCGLLEWQDSLSIGWGIATVWIVTAAVLHLRKAAHA